MRLILAARARNQAKWVPISRTQVGYSRLGQYIAADLGFIRDRVCAHNVTFRARPDAKPVTTFAGRAFAGLRSYGKGANRTRPTRCLAFSGLPQPVRPAALRT